MNVDVCLIPTPHPPAGVSLWGETPYLNPSLSETTTVTWSSTTRPPVPNQPCPARERMERGGGAHHPAPEEAAGSDAPLDARAETQLDFFHKLGYSTAQVCTVLQKFGLNTDTNRVLGELVRTCVAGSGEKEGPVTTMSVLVSRGEGAEKTPIGPPPLTPAQCREQEAVEDDGQALRPVVIDGSNVAMSHGNKEVFSCLGIQLAVRFFLDRGHSDITVFVPSWRREQPRPDVPITDQHILRDLERRKILVFTPSRRVAGKRVVCYDDRFIVKLAYESDGIIVSNDTYRDLQGEKPEWKRFIEDRLLMYSFVSDKFMPPDDPLGRHGPTLDNFLRRVPRIAKKQPCPYGKKCTYGVKCKFHHPERTSQSHRSLADELREKARLCSSPYKPLAAGSGPGLAHGLSLEDELAQKLTLEQWRGSLKKGQMSENVIVVKGSHRSSRRAPSRKDKSSHHSPSELDSVLPGGSQEQLDSGLGSIESQPTDAPWDHGDHHYSAGHRSCQSGLSMKQHYNPPPQNTHIPCSCCSHFPPSLPGSHQNRHPSVGLASTHHNPDTMAYCPPRYPSYGAPVYPVSIHAYSHPAHFQHVRVNNPPPQQQVYWSDPYGAYPQPLCGDMSGEGSHWEPPPGGKPLGPRCTEREGVRKKLLAIFNGRVVDRAMDMFPQLMDPQRLAAEILMLQSQDMTLR